MLALVKLQEKASQRSRCPMTHDSQRLKVKHLQTASGSGTWSRCLLIPFWSRAPRSPIWNGIQGHTIWTYAAVSIDCSYGHQKAPQSAKCRKPPVKSSNTRQWSKILNSHGSSVASTLSKRPLLYFQARPSQPSKCSWTYRWISSNGIQTEARLLPSIKHNLCLCILNKWLIVLEATKWSEKLLKG